MMTRYQTCPPPKKFDKILQKLETRKQCPECGSAYDRHEPDRRTRIMICKWCSYLFTGTELKRIRSGDLETCPSCTSVIKKVKTVRVQDPDQVKLPGVS